MPTRQTFVLIFSAFLCLVAALLPARADDVVQTFTLHESYGVEHPDQIVDFDLAAPLDPTNCYLVGPNGAEVPFQLLEHGKKLALRTHLPASRLPGIISLGMRSQTMKLKDMPNYIVVQSPVQPGDVVRFTGSSLPGGLKPNKDYVCIDYKPVQYYGNFAAFSETMGGPAVPLSTDGNDRRLIVVPLAVDAVNSRIYAPRHGLRNGDPVSFRSSGVLPRPLRPDVQYYVCNADASTFQLATGPNAMVRLLDAGTGVPELHVDWTWTLMRGHAQKSVDWAVKVRKDGNQLVLSNGLTGIRLPLSQTPADPANAPAPVQGIQLADGSWTAAGPNTIAFLGGSTVKKLTVLPVEQGPLKVVAELTYELERAETRNATAVVCPAGPGKYTCRVEVQAGQPSLLFEEETDCQYSYTLDCKGLALNQARWRGSTATSKLAGYRQDGKKINDSCDAFMDLPFDADYAAGPATSARDHTIRWITPWDIMISDSGHYWMLYNKDGADDSPLLGIFDGRASRLRDAGAAGVGVCTRAAGTAGFTIQARQSNADGRLFPHPRFTWRLFVGRKGTDMAADPFDVQPIARQMNLHGGINLNKVSRLSADFAPATAFGSLYMAPGAVGAVMKATREDPRYYTLLYTAVPSCRDLLDLWRDTTGEDAHTMANAVWTGAHNALQTLVSRQGIYGFSFATASQEAGRALLRIDQVLASPQASDADKALARQAAVLYGAVLRDDDHTPLSVSAGISLSGAGSSAQHQGCRDMYTLYLAKHPLLQTNAAELQQRIVDGARATLRNTINEAGAHLGGSRAIDASMGPLLATLQQLKRAGIADVFADEPRLKAYAEFEMNLSTPPDPRFGQPTDPRLSRRVRPAIGDASPGEGTELLGQLGTGFADADPALSARLMGLWRAAGKPESDQYGATFLKVDERLPDADPQLATAHFEGWYSVLRFGWGTPNETTAWFVNGGWYRDRASNDLGETVLYALGAPLSLDFGTLYNPWSPGGFVHNVVLPEASVGDWQQNPPDPTRGPRWSRPKTLDFKAFMRDASSTASFQLGNTTWTRKVQLSLLRDDRPVIGIHDVFSTQESRVFLLNLMSEGPVQTPQGLKSLGDTFAIPAGVTKLHFIGQTFVRHPNRGIDWDLYVVTDTPQQACLASFAHKNGTPETQTILRLLGNGPFQVLIFPYPKGTPAPTPVIAPQDGTVLVTAEGRKVEF
jgi:hypothetical protein